MTFHMTEEIQIGRPPADVWEHVSRLDEELRWRKPYVIGLTADGDPRARGTRIEGTTRALGQTETYVNEVTDVDAPHRLAWRGLEASGALMGTRGSYELESHDGGTRFRLNMEYTPQGLMGRLQEPFLGLVLRRIGRRFLHQLKSMSEPG